MLLNMVMFKVTICDFGKMNINMTDKIEKKEANFAVPYNGEDNNDYVDGKGFCCNDGSLIPGKRGYISSIRSSKYRIYGKEGSSKSSFGSQI